MYFIPTVSGFFPFLFLKRDFFGESRTDEHIPGSWRTRTHAMYAHAASHHHIKMENGRLY